MHHTPRRAAPLPNGDVRLASECVYAARSGITKQSQNFSKKVCECPVAIAPTRVSAATATFRPTGDTMNTNATTFVRYAEPTLRSNVSQAYSQCSPEPSYSYSPEPDYGYGYDSYYGQPAPMQQQPAPVQAPVAQSSSALKPLLVVAGLAVVGAAAFGGVYLM